MRHRWAWRVTLTYQRRVVIAAPISVVDPAAWVEVYAGLWGIDIEYGGQKE